MRHLLCFLLAGTFLSTSFADEASPEAVVKALYAQHEIKSPFFQSENRALLDKFFTPTLATLIWKDARTSQGEVGAIDGDPLYDAQDFEIKGLAVHPAEVGDDTALVTVNFHNFGKKKRIVYTLVLARDVWRISDIRYGDNRTLLGILREAYPKP